MDIAWLRDLVIVIYGLLSILILIVIAFLLLAIFRRVRVILDSVKVTTENIECISAMARHEVAVPIVQVASLIQVVTKTLEAIRGVGKTKKEAKHG